MDPRTSENIEEECKTFFPLYKAIRAGKWDVARGLLHSNPHGYGQKIITNSKTALMVAVATKNSNEFVKHLVESMMEAELEHIDENGFTALHVAVLTKNQEAAMMLIEKHKRLMSLPDKNENLPIHLAAISADTRTLEYLLMESSRNEVSYDNESAVKLLCLTIDSEMFGVALNMAEKYPNLTKLRTKDGKSALQRLAFKATSFPSGKNQLKIWSHVFRSNAFKERRRTHRDALRLLGLLCDKSSEPYDIGVSEMYRDAIFAAAQSGTVEVIEKIIDTYSDTIYACHADTKQTIFHVAVENRWEKVFDLRVKDLYLRYYSADSDGNTILHLAAKLGPPHRINNVFGPVLQMQRELQWFAEVNNSLPPYVRGLPNKDHKIPSIMFSENHRELKYEGEKWINKISTSCSFMGGLIIGIIIAVFIGVFSAVEGVTGFSIFSSGLPCQIFIGAIATSLISSIGSVGVFAVSSYSHYSENDFMFKLPKRLIIGLFALFLSIISMMVEFCLAIFLMAGHRNAWAIMSIAVAICFPMVYFSFLQLPLLVNLIKSTYFRRRFGLFEGIMKFWRLEQQMKKCLGKAHTRDEESQDKRET